MNPISTALTAGLSAKKLLNFFMKKIPSLQPRIMSALAAGMTAEKVIDFIKKPQNFEKIKEKVKQNQIHPSQAENPLVQAEEIKRRSLSQDLGSRLGSAIKSGGEQALKFGSAYAASKALPLLMGNQQPSGPSTNPQGTPPIPPNPNAGGNPPSPQTPAAINNPNQPVQPPQALIQGAKQPVTNVPTPTPNQPIASPLPTPKVDPKEILGNLGLMQRVENLLQSGNTPETIIQGIAGFASPLVKKMLKDPEQQKLISDAVMEYANTRKQGQNETIQGSTQEQPIDAQIQSEGGNIVESKNDGEGQQIKTSEETKKGNGDVVELPDGEIGTVKEIKKDHAIVEVNGKDRPVKLDQMEDLPIPQKDLAELHDDLIKGIEKETGQQVSRNVEWAGYIPSKNRLAYIPWDGGLYIYDDITKEDAKILTSFLVQRKSTGENFIGPWEKGTKSPIGAAMSALIKRLQGERGGKGNEYTEKYEKIYSATEPAVKASKINKKKK